MPTRWPGRPRWEDVVSSKRSLIDSLRAVFDSWQTFVTGVEEKDLTARPGSGKWSVAEVITHLTAWQQVSISRLEAALLDADPRFPAWLRGADPFYAEEHVDEFNERIRDDHHAEPWASRYAAWQAGFLRFLELAETVPDSLMFDAGRYSWLRGYPLAAVLEGSWEHHRDHLERVKEAGRR